MAESKHEIEEGRQWQSKKIIVMNFVEISVAIYFIYWTQVEVNCFAIFKGNFGEWIKV